MPSRNVRTETVTTDLRPLTTISTKHRRELRNSPKSLTPESLTCGEPLRLLKRLTPLCFTHVTKTASVLTKTTNRTVLVISKIRRRVT